jgi:hypothetical protein
MFALAMISFRAAVAEAGTSLQVKVTNVTDTSFTISWVSTASETGYVKYGLTTATVTTKATDVRDGECGKGNSTKKSTVHYVRVCNLLPSKIYYFDVVSGTTTNNNAAKHYQVKTGPTLSPPTPQLAFGQVFQPDGATPATDTIVYLTIRDADGAGTPGFSAEYSVLILPSDGGYWNINLSTARTTDLSSLFAYSTNDVIDPYAQASKTTGKGQSVTVGTATGGAPALTLATTLPLLGPNNAALDGWAPVTIAGVTLRQNNTPGAKLSFKFSGTSIKWNTTVGPDRGKTDVKIDTTAKGTFDSYADTDAPQTFTFSGLKSAAHTIYLTVNASKAPTSTNYFTGLDSFIVGATTTQETAPTISYGNWTGKTDTNALSGVVYTSKTLNSTYVVNFTGSLVRVFFTKGNATGKSQILIDGVVVDTIDSYSAGLQYQDVHTYSVTPGAHTLTIKVLGTKTTASTNYNVNVDAVEIW